MEFTTRLEAHRGIIIKISRAYTRSATDAQDLQQEILTQLWRSYPRYDERFAFSTWMYRVALNVAISFSRRESRYRERSVATEGAIFDTRAAPASARDDPRVEAMMDAISKFDELNRALMILYLDGNSHEAIAAILGITQTNVATKISRLKQQLREEITHGH